MPDVNLKVKSLRESFGYSAKEVAEKIKVEYSNYCRKESGKVGFNTDQLEMLADLFGVSVAVLIEDDAFEDESKKLAVKE